ncbi:hypothetical protein [Streptomyces prasinus]|uniref:hypothetical protein n=1 Tax=Streptomyces prasinus TaxID=67345 RepID=UPI00367DB79D
MHDQAFSPSGSGTALPRVPGASGGPARPGAVRGLSGARFPGPRSAPPPVVAGKATGTRDEN